TRYVVGDLSFVYQAMVEDDDGALLISTSSGIRRFLDGRLEEAPAHGITFRRRPSALMRDHSGALWIGSLGQGLVHVHRGRADTFTHADGLSDDAVLGVFEDREGNVWVCTVDGLDRFRESAATTISLAQGLSDAFVVAVLGTRDGSAWLSTQAGLDRWKDGGMTVFRRRPTKLRMPSASRDPTAHEVILGEGFDEGAASLFEDTQG